MSLSLLFYLNKGINMNALHWLKELNKVTQFMSVEVPGKKATGSELQRWIEQGGILFNGERVSKNEEIDFPLISVVLFPKSPNRKITLL